LIDISDGGAKLAVIDGAASIPDKFIFTLSKNAMRRYCQVKWRTQRHIGVEFFQSPSIKPQDKSETVRR